MEKLAGKVADCDCMMSHLMAAVIHLSTSAKGLKIMGIHMMLHMMITLLNNKFSDLNCDCK